MTDLCHFRMEMVKLQDRGLFEISGSCVMSQAHNLSPGVYDNDSRADGRHILFGDRDDVLDVCVVNLNANGMEKLQNFQRSPGKDQPF
ncbi:hypothetical protein RRF57_007909 [Xylaria bambusicola]|uniref:Uncharacterized protein n=1 Tax=Xylaria bambusicola TaxID=326684 RepID=A0AAN7Z073_9PEZI